MIRSLKRRVHVLKCAQVVLLLLAGCLFGTTRALLGGEPPRQPSKAEAAELASRAKLRQLEERLRTDPNFPNTSDAASELNFQAVMGSAKAVTWLLDHGVPVNPAKSGSGSPLEFAVYGGHEEIVQLLLDRGADVNASDQEGGTALHIAMLVKGLPLYVMQSQPTVAMIDRLLKAGARVGERDAKGRTPLQGVFLVIDPKVIEHLIDRGAEVDTIDSDRRNPLHRAAERGNDAAVSILLAHGGKPDFTDVKGWTPLQLAAFSRRTSTVQMLMQASTGTTDLYVLIATGQQKRIAEVLTGTPGLTNESHGGWTPLHWAFQTHQPQVAHLLIERAADVNAVGGGDARIPALNVAIQNGMDFTELLAHHANPNAADAGGNTPLSVAVSTLDVKPVQQLLKAGANVNTRAGNEPNALKALAAISDGSGKPTESIQVLDALLAAHPDADAINSALAEASRGRQVEMVTKLMAAGADPNAGAGKRWTALHYAVRESRPEVVAALLKGGSNANAEDQNGDTPLQSAMTANQPSPEVVRLLLDHGADPLLKFRNDRNAIELAEFNQRPELAAVIRTFLAEKNLKKKL